MKFPDPPAPPVSTTTSTSSIGVLIITLMCLPILIILKAFVITQLWEWYMVHQFGVPQLTLAVAFGITVLVNLIIHVGYIKDERPLGTRLSYAITMPLMALLLGWIGTFFL